MVWVKRILLLLAVLGVAALFVWAFRPQPLAVDLAEVRKGEFVRSVEEDGQTRVRERYVVSAPVAGRLLRISLKAGDAVEEGAVVATIMPSPASLLDARAVEELQARLRAAESARLAAQATVARAQAALAQAESDLVRAEKLMREGFVSPSALEQARTAMTLNARDLEAARFQEKVAEYGVAQARAALMQAGAGGGARSKWEIRSPVAGRVLRVMRESEGVVPVGTGLLEIADPADLEIIADLLTTDAVNVAPGAPVEIRAGMPGAPLRGQVRRVEPGAFTKISALGVEEQRVNVVIDILGEPERRARLGDAYRVDVAVELARREAAVLAPVSALFRDASGWAVFKVSGGRASKQAVELEDRGALDAVVRNGVQPGDRVIVYPGDTVADGVRVEARPAR